MTAGQQFAGRLGRVCGAYQARRMQFKLPALGGKFCGRVATGCGRGGPRPESGAPSSRQRVSLKRGKKREMSVRLNHTIVWCRDKQRSAKFLASILGLPEPKTFGPFLVVELSNGVSLDFYEKAGDISKQHYAFLVSEEDFDEAFRPLGMSFPRVVLAEERIVVESDARRGHRPTLSHRFRIRDRDVPAANTGFPEPPPKPLNRHRLRACVAWQAS
jgi:catechol 2,3-dioxygenase-like lactoylglutathione lyase family enzyme